MSQQNGEPPQAILITEAGDPGVFEVEAVWEANDGAERRERLFINVLSLGFALRQMGATPDDGLSKESDDKFVMAVRQTARPSRIVAEVPDHVLYAKASAVYERYTKLGESQPPTPISPQSTASCAVRPE